ncbi:hypothetical protein J1N35_023876 [Gossypium stocksii]|uniref:C-JID domain-containing protein n=1 Tax=Gossypium stocksii TaxID=47602 RepID=A0A9D4A4D8_9ROSI|nr:hypothetical protein J1N35_023876 [Gossypium stocksii]
MPGSEIPEWFNQQKSDSSINIPLPKDSQWIGVASCCIFINNDASRDRTRFRCDAHCRASGKPSFVNGSGWTVLAGSEDLIMKDHLFLRYWTRDRLYPISAEDEYGHCDEFEVSFMGRSAKVKKCGVRIVYEKDLEEIKELECHTTQSSHNHGPVDSTSHIKRKASIYDEAEEEGRQPKRMQKIFNFIMGQSGEKH